MPLTAAKTVATEGAAVDVAVNVIGLPDNPGADAVTVFVPGVAPSVNVVAAVPSEFDKAEPLETEPPPEVTANDTVVPETGFPLTSVTWTTKGPGSA